MSESHEPAAAAVSAELATDSPALERVDVLSYAVTAAGQVSVPAGLRHRLGLSSRGVLDVCYFQGGAIILPHDKAEQFIKRTFPFDVRSVFEQEAGESQADASDVHVASENSTQSSFELELKGIKRAFRPYRVTAAGQISLPIELRRTWGVSNGGRVGLCVFNDFALVLPEDDRPFISISEVDKLLQIQELICDVETITPPQEDYKEYVRRMGVMILNNAKNFIASDVGASTALDEKLVEAIVRDALESVYDPSFETPSNGLN